MIILITYLLLSLAVSLISFGKRISFVELLFISIFFTPITGLITVLKAENNILTHHYTTTHTCTSCDIEGAEDEKTCSRCGSEMEVSYREESNFSLA